MDAIIKEVRYAARSLARSPGFAAAVVATLALGLGAATAIFALLEGVVLRPLAYPEPDRLVWIDHPVPSFGPDARWELAPGGYFYYREHSRSFESLAVYRVLGVSITGDGPAERMRVGNVSGEMFSVLHAQPALGRLITVEDDRPASTGPDNVLPGPIAPVAVLGHDFWERRYGADPEVIGRTIVIGGDPVTVVGVLEADTHLPGEHIDVWTPMGLNPVARPTSWHQFSAIGRLRPGISVAAAKDELTRLTARFPQAMPNVYGGSEGFRVDVRSLHAYVVGSVRGNLWMLFGAVSLILLIASANVANLFLVRSESRRREVGIRAALGGTRSHLARISLAESTLLMVAAGGVSLALAAGAIRSLVAIAPAWIPRLSEVGLDWSSFAFVAGLTTAGALVFGIVPVLRSAISLGTMHSAGLVQSVSRRRRAVRDVIVVAQMALALVLLAGAGLLARSFVHLRNVDPGLDPRGVLTLQLTLPTARYPTHESVSGFYAELTERIEALPGVQRVGFTDLLPLEGRGAAAGCATVFIEDRPNGDGPCVPTARTAPGVFEALRIPVQGRIPDWSDATHQSGAVVVSQALADRLWPGEDPIGKGLRPNGWGEPFYRVVGVAADVLAFGLDEPPVEAYYLPPLLIEGTRGWGPPMSMTMVVRSDRPDPAALTDVIRGTIAGLDPDVPLANVRTMSQVVGQSMARTSFTMLLLGIAAGMSLFLSGIGLYGLITYTIAQRTNEIGLRMALGARVRQVAAMVVRQALTLAIGGIVFGLIGAAMTTHVLESFLFGTSPMDPSTLGVVAMVLLGIALLASWLPSATRREGGSGDRAQG